MSLAEQLHAGVGVLKLNLPDGAEERLIAYIELIRKWNRVHNLTAVREPARMVTQHLLDCLAVVPHLRGPRVLDVGSGAGLPGIVVALACPDRHVTLLESNHKKSAFLQQAIIELGLSNADVACERVEAYRPDAPYDVVISRAFSDIPEFATLAGRHVAPDGALMAMKGLYPFEELTQLPDTFRLREVIALAVPGLKAQRHLVVLARA